MSDPRQAVLFSPVLLSKLRLTINKVRGLILQLALQFYIKSNQRFFPTNVSTNSALCLVKSVSCDPDYLGFLKNPKRSHERFKRYSKVMKSLILPLRGLEGIYVPEVITSRLFVGVRLKGDLYAAIFGQPSPFASIGFESKLASMKRLSQAVASLHQRNIVHRDIKSANVLLDKDGAMYLCDWDQAKSVNEEGFLTIREDLERQYSEAYGTELYFSPETWRYQLEYLRLPPSALNEKMRLLNSINFKKHDVWCLGLTFWEMVTGKRVYLEFYNHLRDTLFTHDYYVKNMRAFFLHDLVEAEFHRILPSLLSDCRDCFKGEDELFSLIGNMLSVDPVKRPAIEEVFQTINLILASRERGSANTSALFLCVNSQASSHPTLPSSVERLPALPSSLEKLPTLPASCGSTESESDEVSAVSASFANLAVMPRREKRLFDAFPPELTTQADYQHLFRVHDNLENLMERSLLPEEVEKRVSQVKADWKGFCDSDQGRLFKITRASQQIFEASQCLQMALSAQK